MIELERPDGSTVELSAITLLQWKHAIRLEILGMKHSRRSVSAHAKKVLGLRRGLRKQNLVTLLSDILQQYESAHLGVKEEA